MRETPIGYRFETGPVCMGCGDALRLLVSDQILTSEVRRDDLLFCTGCNCDMKLKLEEGL